MKFKFQRDFPSTAKETQYATRRTLDYTHFDDCITGKELTKLTEMDCDADPEASSVVVFR